MKETRRYATPRRRFTRTDLFCLASIFRENFEQASPSRSSLSITLHCSEGVTYESDTVQHLEENDEIDRRHVNAVSFSFIDYAQQRRIDLQVVDAWLVHLLLP